MANVPSFFGGSAVTSTMLPLLVYATPFAILNALPSTGNEAARFANDVYVIIVDQGRGRSGLTA